MSSATKRLLTVFVAGALCAVGGPARAGLIAHYGLDAASGGTTPDSTGLNGDGTLNGTVTAGATGILGGAFQFIGGATGNAEYVSIADAAYGLGQVTASVWLKPTTINDQGPLARWVSGATNASILIRTDAAGNVQEFVHNGTSQIGGNFSFPTQSVSTTAFNLLTLAFDGRYLVAYLNGEKATNSAAFGTSGNTLGVGGAGTVAIGGRSSLGSERIATGLIDDVSFFNEKLSDGKIRSLFTLATNSTLNYNASQAETLFKVDADGQTRVVVSDKLSLIWTQDAGLPGGHVDGDVWFDSSTSRMYVQFGTTGGVPFGVQAIVPEPSALAMLLGLGVVALVGFARRRRRGD